MKIVLLISINKFVLQNKHGKISKNITTIKIGPFIFEYLYLMSVLDVLKYFVHK